VRRVNLAGLLLLPWIVVAVPAGVPAVADGDSIVIVGGQTSVAAAVGLRRFDEQNFLNQLNVALLSVVRPDNDWKLVRKRRVLFEYIQTVGELREAFPNPLHLSGDTRGDSEDLRNLAETLGYRPRIDRNALVLTPKEGDRWERRRHVARALGWDPPTLLQRLLDIGEDTRLELSIDDETIDAPMPLADWSDIVGRPVTEQNALAELATDQTFGLLIEGLRRSAPELAIAGGLFLRKVIYRETAIPFYRYGSAFQMRDGRLRLPGGDETGPAWGQLIGIDPAQASRFVLKLLQKDEGRAAFLWHSLYFCDPQIARFYIDRDSSTGRSATKVARRFYRRLGATADNDRFNEARGARLGFAGLARALPLAPDGDSLALPGGLGVWYAAIRGDQAPKGERGLDRIVGKGEKQALFDEHFIERSLSEGVKIGSIQLLALPRLIQVVRLWNTDGEKLTPENIVLLSRATERYPALLDTVEDLAFSGPGAIRDYLLTVGRLDGLGDGVDKFVLLANFQGGSELLRLLNLAGRVPRDMLAEALDRWIEIHRESNDPMEVGPALLEWTRNLYARFPAADDAPGRGPLERAFLQALVPIRDPQRFTFQGLAYQGRRGHDLASSWAELLTRQGVPSADRLEELGGALDDLEEALTSADPDAVVRLADEIGAMVEALPTPGFGSTLSVKVDRERFAPVDRPAVGTVLRKIGKVKKSAKLPKLTGQVHHIRELLVRELRPLFLAPAYLEAAREAPRSFEDPDLIRKHAMVRDFDPLLRPVPLLDSPWIEARVVPSAGSGIGSHVAGYLGSTQIALQKRELGSRAAGATPGSIDPTLTGLLLRAMTPKSWSGIDETMLQLLFRAHAAGEEIVARAFEQLESGGVHREFVEARLPSTRLFQAARLEDPLTLVSVSERVQLGIAAAAGDRRGGASPGLLGDATLRSLEEVSRTMGPHWRDALSRFGPPLIHVNGRRRSGFVDLPSYEALQDEGSREALWERLTVDLQLTVLVHLGASRLPETVGRDLLRQVLENDLADLRQISPRDWVGVLIWLRSIDKQKLDEGMRKCLAEGSYQLQLS